MTATTAHDEMNGRDVVVVGASAGGVEVLQQLAAGLPRDLDVSVFVVLHVPSHAASVLPTLLARAGPLPAAHARDGERVEAGRIYVAPPDRHLLLDGNGVRLVRGPKENGHRPAVDPLFRTAARRYGSRVVGVVLSGALDDGTAGLGAIKRAGGLTVVQDPDEALYPSMPRSALERVEPDYVLAVREIAALLGSATDGPAPGTPRVPDGAVSSSGDSKGEDESMEDPDLTQLSPGAGTEYNEQMGQVTRFTCPECSGSLWELQDSELVKLRCRVGHTFTEESLFAVQATSLEAALWSAMTALEEKADFSRRLAARFDRNGQPLARQRYEEQSRNAVEQMELIRHVLLNLEAPPVLEERQAS